MRKAVLIVCLIVSGFLQAQVTFHDDDLMTIAKVESDANAGKFVPGAMESTTNFDVKWYRCRWNIDPTVKEISGNITTLFIPIDPGFDSLVFDMNQSLTVDSVLYRDHPAAWDHSSNLLTIHFSSTLPEIGRAHV